MLQKGQNNGTTQKRSLLMRCYGGQFCAKGVGWRDHRRPPILCNFWTCMACLTLCHFDSPGRGTEGCYCCTLLRELAEHHPLSKYPPPPLAPPRAYNVYVPRNFLGHYLWKKMKDTVIILFHYEALHKVVMGGSPLLRLGGARLSFTLLYHKPCHNHNRILAT